MSLDLPQTDMLVMVKMIAQSADRALGLLIAKDKVLDGMQYQCFF